MNENHYVSTKPKCITRDENIRDSNDRPKCEREISGFRCISTRVSAGDHNALPKNSTGFQVLGKRKVSIFENETNLTKKAKFDTSNGNLVFVTPSHFRVLLSLPLHYGPILSGNIS